VTARGSVIVHGRSDATLNSQGVRMGSAEIYQAVESAAGNSGIAGRRRRAKLKGRYWMPLFVHLKPGARLDDAFAPANH